MPAQGAAVNTDTGDKSTTAYFGDRGDGTSNWFHVKRTFDGGDVAQGTTSDAAVTNPASSGSVVALLKGLLTFLRVSAAGVGKAEDAAHVSGDTGIMPLAVRRDTATASSGSSGDYEPLQTDSLGRLRTTPGRTMTNATSSALEATRVVKGSAGVLFGIQGHAATTGYVLIGDKSTALNGTSDNVRCIIQITAAGPWSLDFGVFGRQFANGISVGFSSTAPAFASGGANMWVDAQYE